MNLNVSRECRVKILHEAITILNRYALEFCSEQKNSQRYNYEKMNFELKKTVDD